MYRSTWEKHIERKIKENCEGKATWRKQKKNSASEIACSKGAFYHGKEEGGSEFL